MKNQILIVQILALLINLSLFSNPKYDKWQKPSYFRGYNVLYESPKNLNDFIDFKNYGGNLFHIQPDGFFSTDSPYGFVQSNIDGTDMLVNFCRQAGIHYVIGVRSGPGAYDTYDESSGNSPESRVWNTGNVIEQQKYAEMLQMIVQRYRNDTLFVGINLVIEPRPKVTQIPANTSQLYKFFLENVFNIHMDQVYNFWISKIRETDPELPIIVENFAYSTPELFPSYELNDQYIIYSAHDYQPNEYVKATEPYTKSYPGVYWNITTLSQHLYNKDFISNTVMGKLKEFQEQTGAPVFIGEIGMFKPQLGSDEYMNDVLNIFKENGWHFALWDWRRGSGPEWNIEKFNDPKNETWKTVLSKFYAPPVPSQIFPVKGEFASVNPTFRWNQLTAYTSYDLIIEDKLSNDIMIQINDISNSQYTYSGNLLEKGKSYSWKLRSKNPGGNDENVSEWSNSASFYIPATDNPSLNGFALKQNVPNPFNPVTNIGFSLYKNSLVKITVYDVLGREVNRLLNETKEIGNYTISFDGKNLPSGIYIYKLEAYPIDGTQPISEIKRMVLIK